MKFYLLFQKTALHVAVENENTEIVQLLLSCKNININYPYIINTII